MSDKNCFFPTYRQAGKNEAKNRKAMWFEYITQIFPLLYQQLSVMSMLSAFYFAFIRTFVVHSVNMKQKTTP